MTSIDSRSPLLAAAVALRRQDGKVLLLQHKNLIPFPKKWSFPVTVVSESETAEDAIERVLRDHVHIRSSGITFVDTVYVTGSDGANFVMNIFYCDNWEGEPQYDPQNYDDAIWYTPGNFDDRYQVVSEINTWMASSLLSEEYSKVDPYTKESLKKLLIDSRNQLLKRFQSFSDESKYEQLSSGLSPIDIVMHVADLETYYVSEIDRIITIPGHSWQHFNTDQWLSIYRIGTSSDATMAHNRLRFAREKTMEWLDSLSQSQLDQYGNHAERGIVVVGEQIAEISQHDLFHANQLEIKSIL
ncbi:MAG: NUDIX domain-containing protein [Dehalococcoidia bacterium]|nr:NUDIX domain-containing protein [Dehalococcoidia bacterium]